ncbi:MAG: BrnT family toxin [Magnetococcales bacterium]|nr:BrnT family toxin [Magnetococcales bacterium]
MIIEFDPAKAENNWKRHGILFTEAATVLDDPLSVTIEEDSVDEERSVNIGMDLYGRILVVVYTYRGEDNVRIISARRATQNECKQYGG